jgi:hypothetical protein
MSAVGNPLMPPMPGAAGGQFSDPDPFGLAPQPQSSINQDKFIQRDRPVPDEPRRKLVEEWATRVKESREHFERVWRRMRENMAFADGRQWPDFVVDNLVRDDRYVANICLRHVQQRTAELYPNNPTMRAKRTDKIIATTWDGSSMELAQAEQAMQQALATGQLPDPQTMQIMQDAQMVKQVDQLMERIGKTLKLVYDYNIREQTHSFKGGMKTMVRRAIVTGVGYIKLGFQRAMKMRPEVETRIADMSERLANIERLAADLADNEILPDSAEAEELKIAIRSLMQEPQLIMREGLSFAYPDSTSIIPDMKVRSLKNFIGADWVAEEYILTPEEVEEVYMVDVGQSFTAYDDCGPLDGRQSLPTRSRYEAGGGGRAYYSGYEDRCCIWEIYSRKDGSVYVVCDGYPEFLQEPGPPETETERFWPWFAFVMNEGYDEKHVYPQSDIDLIRDMQLELNRARQGLREHRRANRPKTAVAAGILEEPDLEKLRTHPANALLELNALAPGQKIEDVLQPVKMPAIDPNVYDTSQTFEDILRVLGSDQADQGTTTDATATEVSVAQFSQNTDTSSVVDDLNDMLTELSIAASQILLMNVSAETVQKIVGPGAVWPQLDPQTIVENVWLEVDESVNGPPNRQQDVQMLTQIVPLLQRVPGISPEWLAKELIRRMGDDIDLTDAFAEGLPSIEALNQLMGQPPQQPGAGPKGAGKGPPRPPGPGQDPNAQGAQGAPGGGMPPPGGPNPGSLGPRPPPLQYFGNNGNRPGPGTGPPRIGSHSQGMPTP